MFEIISVILSAIALALSVYTFASAAEYQKKQNTIDAINQLQDQVFDTMNLYKSGDIATIAKDNKSEEYKTISKYLARCNHFANAVDAGVYNRKLVAKLCGEYFYYLYKKFEPLIEKKRQGGHTQRYIAFEKFANASCKKAGNKHKKEGKL